MMKYIAFLLVFVPLFIFGQGSPCVGCPPSLSAPGSMASPTTGFNGYTSEVNHFDGQTPDCYLPSAQTLNGVLQGIDIALCDILDRLDSLRTLSSEDSALNARIDSLITVIEGLYNTSIISSSRYVTATADTTGNEIEYDLSVNMDSVRASLFRGVDFSCLTDATNYNDAWQALIDTVCALVAPASDTCTPWTLYSTASVASGITSITVTATPYSVGSVPPDMCLNSLQYIYQVLNADDVVISYGVLNASTTLNLPTAWIIGTSYLDGARTLNLITRFGKEKCASGKTCGTQDSLVTYLIAETELDPLTLTNDTMTIYWDGNCHTINVYANDDIPYDISSAGILEEPTHGTASMNASTGVITYCPDNEYNGNDTLFYYVQDVYGQRDSASVIFTVINSTTTSNVICYDEFRNGTNDTVVVSFTLAAPSGKTFAEDGVLLFMDGLTTSLQLDEVSWMNIARDTVSGTAEIPIADVGASLPTLDLTLQIVTTDYFFYEQDLSITLGTCDTVELFPTESATFVYARPGTEICLTSLSDYIQAQFTITGTGVYTSAGLVYNSGICWDSLQAYASSDSPTVQNNWSITRQLLGTYKTTNIDGSVVNLTATVSGSGNTSSAFPQSSAYNSVVTDPFFVFDEYIWYININHMVRDYLFTTSVPTDPQCFDFIGITNFTCIGTE